MQRQELFGALESPEFARRFAPIYDRHFLRMYASFVGKTGEPLQIPGYQPFEERLLSLALATVVQPELMTMSHCAHRAVSACVVLQYENFSLFDEPCWEIDHFLADAGRFGLARTYEGKNTFLVVHGFNNWFDSADALTLARLSDENLLNCKVFPGRPHKVSWLDLKHLKPVENLSLGDIDKACPKRTLARECNVTLAETSAFLAACDVVKKYHLPPATKTILASTWVPYPGCVWDIRENPDIFGSSADVFSVYGTSGETDDNQSAREIDQYLSDNNLGHFYGPYLRIPKDPGYGWLPAEVQFAGQKAKELGEGKMETLLKRAFNLALSTYGN